MGARFIGDRGLAHSGITRLLGNVSNILVYPKFKRHNARNGVVTTRCAHARSVPAFKVYLNVRVVIVRFTHGILGCTSTGDHRASRGAARGIVSVVRRRGGVARVNNAVHLNTCSYRMHGNDGAFRTCRGRRVSRHRHRHCRFGGRFLRRFRGTNVRYMNVGPRAGLIRVIRIPALG